ncbi:MAG TPA: AI-2E family transporter [Terracidiphilus sp.]|jgi:predicted PurR-regulated permease PerM|nr:AI-2E family transporter [Terracidiphilus sp.]
MNEPFGGAHSVRSNIVFVFAIALAIYVAWLLRDALVLLYVSGLFAVVLRPVVISVSRIQIGNRQPFKGWAVLVMLLVLAGALTAFGFLALPPVIRDLQQFGKETPARSPELLEKFRHIPFLNRMNTDDLNSRIQQFISQAATYLLLSVKNLAGRVMGFVTGVILTIYFILEGDGTYRWFLSFFLPESRDRLDRTLQRAKLRMGKWLVGQGSLMLILGVSSTIVYLLLHVRYAYALGALTGLLNFIPVLGAAISIVLAMLVAAVDSWGRVLGVAIFFAIYEQLENSFLVPHIMRQRVGLPGLAILVALLVGFALAGVMGALVAVPTAVLVGELADEYLVRKELA